MRLSKKFTTKEKNEILFIILITLIPLVHFSIFYLGVNFNSIILAFKSYNREGIASFAGFYNFQKLFQDFKLYTFYKVALKNSFLCFVIGCPLSLTLVLFFSYYIYKRNSKFAKIFKVLLFLPSIIPAIALATMYKQVTDSAIKELMMRLFNKEILGLLQNKNTRFPTILFYGIWCSFGVNMLLLVNQMTSIDVSMVEAAKIDGVNFFTEFIYITFPQVFGIIKTLFIVSLGAFFINTASIVSFYGTSASEDVYTIGYYFYKETVVASLNNNVAELPEIAAFGILLTVITVPVVYLVKKLLEKYGPSTE